MVDSSSSSTRVTWVSTSAGDTPGYTVFTAMMGIAISGNDSLGVVWYAMAPMMAMMARSTIMLVRCSTAKLVGPNSL